MSCPRESAPTGAAFIVLLLLSLPAISLALPAGTPPLPTSTRAALSSAAESKTLLPWQRHAMRRLAARPVAPVPSGSVVDGTWSQLPPPVVEESPGVYDPVRQSMLVFGGQDVNGGSTADVWELSLSGPPAWSLLVTQGTKPSPRTGHALLYDSRRERLLLFGGADSITHNDCWALDLTTIPPTWGEGLPTGTPPSRRGYVQAVYDSLNDRGVLFGGADSLEQDGPPIQMRADVWVLPFTGPFAWSELTPTGTPPSPRAAGAVIYDQIHQRMVLFGGYDGDVLDDAFTLSLDASPAWAPLGASGGPPPARAIPGVVYEGPQDRMVMFGGFASNALNDVWVLDLATPAWTELSPTGGPPTPRQFPAAVYDAPRDRMVIFGGDDDVTGDTEDLLWSLSLGATPAWTDLGLRRPARRWDAATVFDPTRRIMWVHGGDAYDESQRATRSDLWALAVGSSMEWTQPATTGTPLGRRFGHGAIYDATRDRLVFFGGSDTTTYLNDVWTLTGLAGTPVWSQLSPSGTPPSGRKYSSVVYDAVNDRMIVFGGNGGFLTENDVWSLSFAGGPVWTQLAPSGTPPPPLFAQSAALDRNTNRLIVFGGAATGYRNNVHALTLTGSPAWTELFPTGTPPAPRQSASMVSLGTRMLFFGGQVGDFSVASDDTWLLSLLPTPSWRQLAVSSPLPSERFGNCAAFDDVSFSFVIFGGTAATRQPEDAWVLQLDELVPTLASLVSANATPGRVDLAWEVSSSVPARLYRKSGDGPWAELDRVSPDGTGRLVYADLDAVAGSRYGYRLGLMEQGGEVIAGEVWVDVPAVARFALRGMKPNPGPAGAGLVVFSLPDASPARLEVLDVSGRRVFSREVGGLGAGEHSVRLAGAEALRPGVYSIRLTRAGQSLTTKAVATR